MSDNDVQQRQEAGKDAPSDLAVLLAAQDLQPGDRLREYEVDRG